MTFPHVSEVPQAPKCLKCPNAQASFMCLECQNVFQVRQVPKCLTCLNAQVS